MRRHPSPERTVLALVDPDHVEPYYADQRAGLLRALSRAARELLSSARVGPALQPRSPLETG